MLFNSVDFGIFLPIIFILYWFVANHNLRLQNLLIVAASYFFYGCWDWRFLTLIIFSTVIDFWVGLKLSKEEIEKKHKIGVGPERS
jgi:D-alanyl-lipoteichoic acid acyltransferase DltB (MBOAT superfamily)